MGIILVVSSAKRKQDTLNRLKFSAVSHRNGIKPGAWNNDKILCFSTNKSGGLYPYLFFVYSHLYTFARLIVMSEANLTPIPSS